MRNRNSFVGAILVVLGILVVLLKSVFGIKVFEFNTGDLWVFIVLILGLSFELGYFLFGKNSGLLIPGGIITTIGFLFMFEVSTNWHFSAYTWPIYIFSVAVGLFQMYIFSRREKGLLIASSILAGISAFFEIIMLLNKVAFYINHSLVFPVILIIAGVVLIFIGTAEKRNSY